MSDPVSPCFLSHFAALRDPRQATKVLYPLDEILLLMLCATIAGADDFGLFYAKVRKTTRLGETTQA